MQHKSQPSLLINASLLQPILYGIGEFAESTKTQQTNILRNRNLSLFDDRKYDI